MHLNELLDPGELTAAIEQGHVTRKPHPDLPLSILTYTPACQYTAAWTSVTIQCRGLVINHETGEIIAWPFPKFFNIEEHELGRPYAPPLPKDEPFTMQAKADGSLAIIFHYDGRWRAASKGSFTSDQAQWAQKWLDSHDTSRLNPGRTYLAEMIYPDNRIVVDYKGEETLKLLAVYDSNGSEIVADSWSEEDVWLGMGGSVVPRYGTVNLSKILFRAKRNQTFTGQPLTGTSAEGYVLRYESGLRVKVKFPEYVRLHGIITGLTERSVWELLKDGQSLKPLLDVLPDEYHDWLTKTVDRLREQAHDRAVEILCAVSSTGLPADPAAFAPLAAASGHGGAMTAVHEALYHNAWAATKPEAIGPYSTEE